MTPPARAIADDAGWLYYELHTMEVTYYLQDGETSFTKTVLDEIVVVDVDVVFK